MSTIIFYCSDTSLGAFSLDLKRKLDNELITVKKKFKGLHIFKQYIKQMQTAYKCFNLQNCIFFYFPIIIAFLTFHKYFAAAAASY